MANLNLAKKYRVVPVPEGEDSFFESLSVALKTVGLNVTPFDARMGTVSALYLNWSPQGNSIVRFNRPNQGLIKNLEEYKRIMATPGIQPGQREFKAASKAYRVNIKFVSSGFGIYAQYTQTYPGQAKGTIYIQMDKDPLQGKYEKVHFQPLVPIPLLNKLPKITLPAMPQVKLPVWPKGFTQKDVAGTVAAAIANAKTALPKLSTKREPPPGFRLAGFLTYLGKITSVPLYQKENSNLNSQKAARLKSTGQLVTGWSGWKIIGDNLIWKGGKVEVNTNEVAAAIAAAVTKIPAVAGQVEMKSKVASFFASKLKSQTVKQVSSVNNVSRAIQNALPPVTSPKGITWKGVTWKNPLPPVTSPKGFTWKGVTWRNPLESIIPKKTVGPTGERVLRNAKVNINSIARAINNSKPGPRTRNVSVGPGFFSLERWRVKRELAQAARAESNAERQAAKAAANAEREQARAKAKANAAAKALANAKAKQNTQAAKTAAKALANAEREQARAKAKANAAAKAAANAAAKAKAKANREAARLQSIANSQAAIAKARANANAARRAREQEAAKLEELKKKKNENHNPNPVLNAQIQQQQQVVNAAQQAEHDAQQTEQAVQQTEQTAQQAEHVENENLGNNFNINGLNTNTNNSNVIRRLAELFARKLTTEQETMLLRILDARLSRIFTANVNWGNRGNVTTVKAKLLAYQNGLAAAIRSRPRVKQLIGRYVAQFKSFTKNVNSGGGGGGGFMNYGFGSAISYGNSLERRARYAGGPEYFARPGGSTPQYFPRPNNAGRGTVNRGTSTYPLLHPEDPRAKVIAGLSANERKVVSSTKDAEMVNRIIQGAGGPEKVKKAVEVLKYYPKNTAVKMKLVTATAANAVNKLGGPNRANIAVSINRKIQTVVKQKKRRVTKKKAPPAAKPQVRARLLKAIVKKFTKNEIVKIAGENALGVKNNKKKNNLVRNFTKYVRRQPKKKTGSVTKGSPEKKKK